jgi:ubiquinone biosynthesis protein UbiJ
MGANKEICKKIAGHRSMIAEHEAKITKEWESPTPREHLIAYWQSRIDEVKLRITRLEEKLHRR